MENINNIFKFEPYKANEILSTFVYYIPCELFAIEYYKTNTSITAKMLYALLLNRFKASLKNNWIDEEQNIYFLFTRKEACELLDISKNTAIKAFEELKKVNLIFEKVQGINKPNRIYIGKINHLQDNKNSGFKILTSQGSKNEPPEVQKFNLKYINKNIKKKECSLPQNFNEYDFYANINLNDLYEN